MGVLLVAQLAQVEVPAALWRKSRLGELSVRHARLLIDEFEADYEGTEEHPPRFAVVTVADAVLHAAARLCGVHGLRAYDGVQLACAAAARTGGVGHVGFAAFDRRLRDAAAAEGFPLVPS